jgi:hypothetical protein
MFQFLGICYVYVSLGALIILFFVSYYFIIEEWGILIGGMFGWIAAIFYSMFFCWLWPFWLIVFCWDLKHEKAFRLWKLKKSDD